VQPRLGDFLQPVHFGIAQFAFDHRTEADEFVVADVILRAQLDQAHGEVEVVLGGNNDEGHIGVHFLGDRERACSREIGDGLAADDQVPLLRFKGGTQACGGINSDVVDAVALILQSEQKRGLVSAGLLDDQ
jgi:hypothetical protein